MKIRHLLMTIAPGILGAFFFPLVLSSCEEKDQGPDWTTQTAAAKAETTPAAVPAAAEGRTKASSQTLDGSPVRFVAYNVQNWLTMDRYVKGKQVDGVPKPESERQAVVAAILSSKPDILGVSEIGNERDVEDLQKRLGDAGLPLEHSYLSRGSDPTRSLVILSRYPVGKTVVHENLKYQLEGREHAMQRGILDASIQTPAGSFRFLGVHLKSKRESEEGDQEEMRRSEAHLFRRTIDSILQDDAQARLVVYGDFNDTRQSPTVKTVHGSGNGSRLNMIALKDSRGHYWTHHWDFQDVYSRIDYVMVSQALRHSVKWDQCKILDNDAVAAASDHRPLLVILGK